MNINLSIYDRTEVFQSRQILMQSWSQTNQNAHEHFQTKKNTGIITLANRQLQRQTLNTSQPIQKNKEKN